MVQGPVGGAHQGLAVRAQKLIGPEIERSSEVRAAIDPRGQTGAVVDHKTLHYPVAAPKVELGGARLRQRGHRAAPPVGSDHGRMVPSSVVLAIDAREVVKTFRAGVLRRPTTAALRAVSLTVERGAIVGVLGPNGAGKTTLLSILATLLLPDAGQVMVLGHDVVREPGLVRRRLNLASGNASFLWNLRVGEILGFYGRLYGLAGRALRARVEELLEVCELAAYRRTPYNELSTGVKQRLSLAKSLLNDPELLFLDEPTLGLDPDVAVRIRRHIARLRRERGITILLTTHYMREAEELCDEVAFLKHGEILARGTPAALKRQVRLGDLVALRLEPPSAPWLRGFPGVLRYEERDGRVTCTVDDADKRLPELLRVLAQQGVAVRDVQVREPDLEEVFVELAR